MSLSAHSAFFPAFVQTLHALTSVLDKAAAHAEARKIKPEVLLGSRLTPDMLPFTRQIQLCCDFAKNAAVRVGGAENVKFPDEEKSFDELKERIARTLAVVEGVDPAALDRGVAGTVTFPLGGKDRSMSGAVYLTRFAVPNFYFHAATAYDLMRRDGVEIGKRDFLGSVLEA